jgi:predicted Rossmann fold nucleotide-binding protein DprA/Smf involved in DNA uptake
MPEIPDVGAIAQQVKARIKHIEDQLKQHHTLNEELGRLRDALSRLEGGARSRVGAPRRNRKTTPQPASTSVRAPRTAASKPASTPARAPRGQNKAKVLDALKDGPMTASEISKATGIATGTVSTMLTKLTKSGELAKAERGYKLPR